MGGRTAAGCCKGHSRETCKKEQEALSPEEEGGAERQTGVPREELGVAGHLKSGMPLGVLMPAPTMTTTLWQALAWISSAISSRKSFSFLLLPPLPKMLEALAEKDMGLLRPVMLTEKDSGQVTRGS